MAASISFMIGAMLATGASGGAQSDSVIVNLIAQEFVELCVKDDVDIAALEATAERRGWYPRPASISGKYGIRIDRAWDGEVSFIGAKGEFEETAGKFTIAVADSVMKSFCLVTFEEYSLESLKLALSNQGLILGEEYDWSKEGSIWQGASFCLRDPQPALRSYSVEADRRRFRRHGAKGSSRFSYYRNKAIEKSQCPSQYLLGHSNHGPLPESPSIESWLGNKAEEPPKLEEAEPQ